jgi:hypothetical protein
LHTTTATACGAQTAALNLVAAMNRDAVEPR